MVTRFLSQGSPEHCQEPLAQQWYCARLSSRPKTYQYRFHSSRPTEPLLGTLLDRAAWLSPMKYHLLRKSEGTRIQAYLLGNNMRLPGQNTLGHSLMSTDCPFSRGDSITKTQPVDPSRTDSIGPQCPCGSTIAGYQDQILTLTMRDLPKVLCPGKDTVSRNQGRTRGPSS